MRVVHIVRQFHPGQGGLESFVLNLVKQQRLASVNAEVVTLDRLFTASTCRLPEFDCVEGVPVRRIRYWGPSRYPIAPEVLSCIEPFDLVHVHGVDFFCDYLAATRVLHGKPLVLSTHGGFFHTKFCGFLKAAYFNTVTRLALRHYRRVLACSAADEVLFRKVVTHGLVRIDNGVDTTKFADAGSQHFSPTFVYFGRFARNKGLDRLVAAFDLLRDQVPGARLHLMGRDWDDVLVDLKRQISALRHPSAFELHIDPSDDKIRDIISHSSIFVSASHYEGFGLALVEALSAGLLPVASRIPSFCDILEKAGVGLVAPFDDPEAAARQIAQYLEEAEVSYSLKRSEAIRLAARYAWPTVAGSFMREYEHVLGSRERRLLGVRLRSLGQRQAVVTIDREIASSRRLYIGFANAHTLNVATSDVRLRAALDRFLLLNDGLGVDIASRLKFGSSFAANLNGTDFVPHYLANTSRRLRIYLVGTGDGAVKSAAEKIAAMYPRHRVVGWRNGFFDGPNDCEGACQKICAAGADCVLVGMGNPHQELWISDYGEKTGAKVLFGVGALFDFQAERVRRAPGWVRSLRCEWLYRLLQEPRRLAQRYLVGNFIFLKRVLADVRS